MLKKYGFLQISNKKERWRGIPVFSFPWVPTTLFFLGRSFQTEKTALFNSGPQLKLQIKLNSKERTY